MAFGPKDNLIASFEGVGVLRKGLIFVHRTYKGSKCKPMGTVKIASISIFLQTDYVAVLMRFLNSKDSIFQSV